MFNSNQKKFSIRCMQFAITAAAIALASCGGDAVSPTASATLETKPIQAEVKVTAPFWQGTSTLLAMGQDNDTIAGYVVGLGAAETPGAVVSYIGMDLSGLSVNVDNGAGRINTDELAKTYPNSALIVAVDAVGKLPAINAGSYDANITTLVKTLVSYKRPIFLRFGYEFDGPWNNYDPVQYKAAWIRIYNKIIELKARDNIMMVWQSASYCGYSGLPFASWYPGDTYVDLVAVSFFTPGQTNKGIGSGSCVVANQAVDALAAFAKSKSKPLMIAESTPLGFSLSESRWKAQSGGKIVSDLPVTTAQIWTWYNNYFTWIRNNNVRVASYINTNWESQAMWGAPYNSGIYWGDARIQSNAAIKASWITSVAGFTKASPSLFANMGYVAQSVVVTPPPAPSVTRSITVRLRGGTGNESVTLRVNNIAIKTWKVTKLMTDTAVSTTATGNIQVLFTNDTATNDVQVDYISVNGVIRQAEAQTINTGVYQSGKCGGGLGKSEWLHCNGYIDFGT